MKYADCAGILGRVDGCCLAVPFPSRCLLCFIRFIMAAGFGGGVTFMAKKGRPKKKPFVEAVEDGN
jgi:hypothetical protein